MNTGKFSVKSCWTGPETALHVGALAMGWQPERSSRRSPLRSGPFPTCPRGSEVTESGSDVAYFSHAADRVWRSAGRARLRTWRWVYYDCLNLFVRVVNSQRLSNNWKTSIKCWYYRFLVYKWLFGNFKQEKNNFFNFILKSVSLKK